MSATENKILIGEEGEGGREGGKEGGMERERRPRREGGGYKAIKKTSVRIPCSCDVLGNGSAWEKVTNPLAIVLGTWVTRQTISTIHRVSHVLQGDRKY